jgi:hypothetical protein
MRCYLLIQFGENFKNDGAEDQQHAKPDRQYAGFTVAKVEANGEQQHTNHNGDQHGIKGGYFEHVLDLKKLITQV